MKALKIIKFSTLTLSLLGILVIYSSVNAQEYDDMYFNKSDRKTVKVEKTVTSSALKNTSDYKKITESTEAYSAKNINPEYIARYKSSESNEVSEETSRNDG